MKEINMTKAISCMPDKFITMEMVELAATEHRPELVNYLPEKYITSEILDSIFKTDDYGWRSWQLSKIPEEKRNRQICLRAIKAEKSNFPDIPEKYRNSDILESLFAHRNFMHYLHLIPSSSWNNGPVRDAIYSLYRDVQQNGGYRYCSERYEQQFLYETSVMLSFVPRQAKDFRLWKELIHDGRIATMTIDKMMPKCFKQAAYYKEWAIRCIKEVDTRWLDYDTVWKAICHKTGNLHGIFDSYGHYEWFSKHADDAMADKAMELEPNLFNKLPRRFRTPERLIHTLEVKREINSYNFILEPNLMTKEVCMALARRDSFYPDIPSERWNRELVEYFTEYGHSLRWLPQLPKKLQTRKLAQKVLKEKPQYFHYLRMEFITPEMSRLLCQKDQDNIRYFKERVMEFQKYTGLPAEFYGCETDFKHIRDRDDSRRYCRIGLAYIALQKCKRGWHESEYYLIMTRHPNRYMPAKTVFRKQITTFHRTWLEKTICDNDPQFRIPKIQKDLKDVQAMRYYEVEHIRTIQIEFETPACIRLAENPDGTLRNEIECCKRYPELDTPYFNVEFTPEVKQNLLEKGNAGCVVELELAGGVREPCLVSLNPKTNRLHHIPVSGITIPAEVNGTALTDEQRKRIASGESVLVENMWSEKKQRHYDARLQFNACKGGFDYDFKGIARRQEQTAAQEQEQNRQQERGLVIPARLKGKDLSEEQQASLAQGKATYIKDMTDNEGNLFSAFVRVNHERAKFDFFKWNPDKSKKQEQSQQAAVRQDGTKPANAVSRNRPVQKADKKGVSI